VVLKHTGFRQLHIISDGALLSPSFETCPNNLSLYLSDSDTAAHAATNRYRDFLGHEFNQVVIDCRNQLNFDAIAALCGTLMAGGELVLLTPQQPSPALNRLIDCWQMRSPIEATSDAKPPSLPTAAQQDLVQQLQDKESVHIVIASRGRGKSSCLGTALAQADNASQCIVTAPRKANAQVLLKHAPHAHFVAWDTLIEQPGSTERLIIDEAAGIPLWAIQKLVQKYPAWMLATTVDGYEGCGRGFAIHFVEWAERTFAHVKMHTLQDPIRWLTGDPLEYWLQQALLLNAAPRQLTQSIDSGVYHASELPEDALHQAFELLLEAHYQSSPNDLKLLLDEPQHYLYLHVNNGSVIAVAWLALEGPLADDLALQVQLGKRRPPGNLLPQSLTYFLQSPRLAALRWCRVSRIAVQESHRRQHIASNVLNAVRHWVATQNVHALGTSFGYEPGLAQFWRANGYHLVRLSSKQDRVSARYASLWVSPITPDAEALCTPLCEWGAAQQRWWFNGQIPSNTLDATTNALLSAFKEANLPLDSVLFACALVSKHDVLTFTPSDFAVPQNAMQSLKHTYKADSFKQLSALMRSDIAKIL